MVWHVETDRMAVAKLCVGPLENNAYLVACRATGAAVVIDAADEADRIVAAAAGLAVQAVLTTHGHWDHVQAAAEVCRRLDAPFRIHAADAERAGVEPAVPVSDGEEIAVGALAVAVLHTPGHTPGSCCYLVDGLLFTGDTLFPGGPGATGDPESSFSTIMESLERRLFVLDDATLVLPGHGLDTTIGHERPSLPAWWVRGC